MERRIWISVVTILCIFCGILAGALYYIQGTDGEFELAYQNAQTRIGNLEEQLERSRGDIGLLREENQRVRRYADEVEGDRIKLAEVNRTLETIVGQLRADNRRLASAISQSRARFEIIAGGLEDLERILQEIESQ